METKTQQEKFEIGSRVHCILYGGRDGIVYGIRGEQKPGTVLFLGGGAMVTGGSAYLDIVFEDGSLSTVPEAIAMGCQWERLEGIATAEEIREALEVSRLKKLEREAAAKREAEERAVEVARLRDAYPYLIHGSDLVTAAKNMRTELKLKWPSVKFSVKTSRFSGGDSIDVHWTDGPTKKQVVEITEKYQEGSFDGMTDSYNYARAPWTGLFGGAKYVLESRSLSEIGICKAMIAAKKEFGDKDFPTPEQYKAGQAYKLSPMSGESTQHWSWQEIIRRTENEMEFS